MTIYINTKDREQITVSLKNKTAVLDTETGFNKFGSQVLLSLLEKILENNHLTWEELTEIEVETGPGSFTGVRVGVTVANALGFGLGIPVNGKKIETDIRYT